MKDRLFTNIVQEGVHDLQVEFKPLCVPPSNLQLAIQMQQRRARIALAPRTVQNIPDLLSRKATNRLASSFDDARTNK